MSDDYEDMYKIVVLIPMRVDEKTRFDVMDAVDDAADLAVTGRDFDIFCYALPEKADHCDHCTGLNDQ